MLSLQAIEQQIILLKEDALKELSRTQNETELQNWHTEWLGRKGIIHQIFHALFSGKRDAPI